MTNKLQISKKQAVKKAVQAHNRRVDRDNAAFEKMSPAEKRVQIARDVIAQLNSKRLIAEAGLWLTADAGLFNEKDIKSDPEVKDLLSKVKECRGCALGGMFMCAVERANKLKFSQLECGKNFEPEYDDIGDEAISMNDTFSYMKKFFTQHQLELIEAAFEQGVGVVYGRGTGPFNQAVDFANDIDDPSIRMRLIMENIIKNKGIFKPRQKPICVWQTPGFINND